MAWSEDHERLFVMQNKTVDVWDIVEEKKVSLMASMAFEVQL